MPTINIIETGKNIEKMRKEAGITVKQMQEIFGFANPQAIYKWIRGISLPAIDNLVIMATVFNCKIDDILVIDVPEEKRKTA